MTAYGEIIPVWDTIPEVDGVPAQEIPTIECYPACYGDARGSILILPGGGYRCRVEHERLPIVGWLNSIGINAYVVHYRVAPHRFPAGLADVQRAVRIIRDRNRKDGRTNQKLGVIGFSAGGHLAGCAVTMFKEETYPQTDALDQLPCRVDAGLLCYAVLPMDSESYTHKGSRANLLGETHTQEQRIAACPVEKISAETPPCFIWHTTTDNVVLVQNSLAFSVRLADHKIPYELHVWPRGGHGLTTFNREHDDICADWMTAARAWLVKQGF